MSLITNEALMTMYHQVVQSGQTLEVALETVKVKHDIDLDPQAAGDLLEYMVGLVEAGERPHKVAHALTHPELKDSLTVVKGRRAPAKKKATSKG